MEIVLAVILDLNAAAFFVMMQLDVGGEMLLKPVLQVLNGRGKCGRSRTAAARRFRSAIAFEMAGDQFFGGAHGQTFANDFLREHPLFVL